MKRTRFLGIFVNPVKYEIDPYKAAEKTRALAVMTEWDLYTTLNYERIFKSMVKPAFIFDGRNILNHEKYYQIGFHVYPLGQPKLSHL